MYTRELADAVQDEVDNLLTDGVVTTGEVVGGILLTGDQLFGVKELTVRTRAHPQTLPPVVMSDKIHPTGLGKSFYLIDHGGLQIDEDRARDVLAGTSLGEEGVEGVIAATDGFVGGHLTIRLDSMLQTEQLPARITDLDTGLSNVDAE